MIFFLVYFHLAIAELPFSAEISKGYFYAVIALTVTVMALSHRCHTYQS